MKIRVFQTKTRTPEYGALALDPSLGLSLLQLGDQTERFTGNDVDVLMLDNQDNTRKVRGDQGQSIGTHAIGTFVLHLVESDDLVKNFCEIFGGNILTMKLGVRLVKREFKVWVCLFLSKHTFP